MKKGIENMMQCGLAFELLLARIWLDFSAKLGGMLEPSWPQNQKKGAQEDVKKNDRKQGAWRIQAPSK